MNVRRPQDSPFISRDLRKLIGVLGVDRSIVSGEISDEEFQILKIFAGQAAIAINGLRR